LTAVEIFEDFLGYPKTSGGIRHRLCRRAHEASQALLDLGPAFDAVEPQLYGLRWARLLFLREFDAATALAVWDGLFAAFYADGRKSLPRVVEAATTALTCAAAPQLPRDDECEQLQVLMKYADRVTPDVAVLVDVTARLVDGRGLPPASARAPPPARAAAITPPPLVAPAPAPRAADAVAALAARMPSAPAFLKQTPLFAAPPARSPPPPAPPAAPAKTLAAKLDAARDILAARAGQNQDVVDAIQAVADVAKELRKRGL